MRRIGTATLAMVAITTMTACTGNTDSVPTSSPSVTPSEVAVPSLGPSPLSPAPESAIDFDSGEIRESVPEPEWDQASREAALEAAETAMAAFARPDLSFDEWWERLQPLLDQTASLDYSYMDPAVIPATTITGPAVMVDDTSAYVATIDVPTDVGTYTLILSRADASSPWLTSRFTPPSEGN